MIPLLLLVLQAGAAPTHPAPVAQDPVVQDPVAQDAAAEATPHVEYLVTIDAPETGTVRVEARVLLGPGQEELVLSLPEHIAFATLEAPRLESLTAGGAGGEALAVERLAPYRWRVATGDAAEVTLGWEVPQDHRTLPAVQAANDAYEFPYLDAQAGMLVAGTLFLRPHETAFTSRVRFQLPLGWQVLAPWPDVDGTTFEPESPAALADDLIAVGSWETDRLSRGGFEAVVGFAPETAHLRGQIVPMILRIVASELELFGAPPGDRYLFLFGRPDSLGFGGSPKTGSMTLLVPAGAPEAVTRSSLGHLIAHEFHHTWLRSIVELPGELRFYNEGVTDYHAYSTAARLGLQHPEELRNEFQLALASWERHAGDAGPSLVEAGGPAFFSGAGAYRTVYDGGLVVGLWLDLALRRSDHELRDFLRAFNNDERWRAGRAPTLDDWLAVAHDLLPPAAAARLTALVRGPGPGDLVEAFGEVGVGLEREESRAVGPLRANLQGTTLAEMDPQGLAARLGLLPGDRLLELNGVDLTAPGSSDGNALRAAWMRPLDDRVRVRWERAGETMEMDGLLPLQVRYGLPLAVVEGLL